MRIRDCQALSNIHATMRRPVNGPVCRKSSRPCANLPCFVLLTILLLTPSPTHAQRYMENLDRGVVAVNQGDDGVFVTWRLLGTDPPDLPFNVYRQTGDNEPIKLSQKPLTGPTHFTDTTADLSQPNRYFVRVVMRDREEEPKGSYVGVRSGVQ